MTAAPANALLLVISGPSGSGKTTLCRRLQEEFASVTYSVSCTTRPMRPGDTDGVDYRFLDRETFDREAAAGAFIESAEVHGHRYGTLRHTIEKALGSGRDVLMDIDVQGAAQIRERVRDAAPGEPLHDALVDVFIEAPSLQTLGDRLRGRGQDRDEVIEKRLENATGEVAHAGDYRYRMVNQDLNRTYDVLRGIVLAEHHRVREGTGVNVL